MAARYGAAILDSSEELNPQYVDILFSNIYQVVLYRFRYFC